MSEDDKQVFEKAKPFIVGLVALMFQMRDPGLFPKQCFERAEEFVIEFERRNT